MPVRGSRWINESPMKPKKPVRQRGKLGKCLRCGCLTLLAFLLAIFVFIVVISTLDEKSTAFLTKYLVAMSYPLLRYSRLMFLPVHGMFNVTEYYSSECLVSNPWFDESPDSCWHCRFKKNMKEMSPNTTLSWRDEWEVAVFRGSLKETLTFADLQQMFKKSKGILQGELRAMTLVSNRSDIISLEDILERKSEEDILNDRGLHFQWKTAQSLAANRVIRQFFGRPSFVNAKQEISFEKNVIIQSPGTVPYDLPGHNFPNGWYMQVTGTRKLKIKPTSKCQTKCKSFDVTLEPRDALVYNPPSWIVQLLPAETSEISVGYMGSFS
ncbi:uncharacterized protein LOC135467983 [Liolophura sinensis]|uniref:uncharacterized protein LOC135467983 n=1 Tax=Liolophura sinensis TaxID=3198878 RepID=UPI003158FB9A